MEKSSNSPEILEVTLRDGSYLVDFQFTAEDTALIASALDSAGFCWIEVGHGLGLNASAAGKGVAAASDEEYMEAAAQAVQHGRWGMFFIPGIGRAEDLRLAARYGMGFVRVGTNTTDLTTAQPFIELAKELGMIVSYNAMKSYAVPPGEFGRCVGLASRWGADVVCLVDSAGGMYPEDVAAYLEAAREACDARLGFHGHDNLALAMANTIRAIECGATLLDSSLQGIGRSAGNTITEVLVAIMKRRGLLPAIELNTVTDLGQALIQPTLRRRGMDPMAVIGGSARFHSSFTPKLQAYAKEYGLDVRDLIVRLCEVDQIEAPDGLLKSLSQELASRRMQQVVSVRAFSRSRPSPVLGLEALDLVLKKMHALAVKAGKFSALNIVIGEEPLETFRVSANIQESHTHVIGSVTLTCDDQLASVLKAADRRVDVVFQDIDPKPLFIVNPVRIARANLENSQLFTYSDRGVWVRAVEDQVVRLLNEELVDLPIVIVGDDPNGVLLSNALADRGSFVTILTDTDRGLSSTTTTPCRSGNRNVSFEFRGSDAASRRLREARLIILWTKGSPTFGAREVSEMQAGTWILDAGIGSISPEGLEEAHQRGVLPVRVNIWPALAAALLAAHESACICQSALGWETIAGISVVAGGALGRRGDVIVDSVREPTRVIGIADGHGGVIFNYSPVEEHQVRRVSDEIQQRLVSSAPVTSR